MNEFDAMVFVIAAAFGLMVALRLIENVFTGRN